MPTKEIMFLDKKQFEFDDVKIAFVPPIIKLKRTDGNGRFAWDGKFQGPAEIICPNFQAGGLTELFAFEEYCEYNGGNIMYQLSNDNGKKWFYWNGASWIETVLDFNTAEEIDKNISSFPLTAERQIKLKMKLSPSTDFLNSPELKIIALHYELDYDWFEDIKRTLKHYLENNFSPKLTSAMVIPIDTALIVLNTNFQVRDITGVYNLTADPNRLVNIFSSLEQIETGKDQNGEPIIENRINLSSIQSANSIIEVCYRGTVPVFLSADEDFQVARLPSILVEVPSVTENLSLRNFDRKTERSQTNFIARTRQQPVWYDAQIIISCISESELESLKMVQELQRIFNIKDMKLVSEASGEELEVYDLSPFTDSDRPTIGLSVKQINFILCGRYWLGKYEEKELAQELELNVQQI
ncbi:MAG: hypothetical protein AB1349_01585 [Elusimicrobiota bacterium]